MSEDEIPSVTKFALVYALAFPAILILTVAGMWLAGVVLPYFDIEIEYTGVWPLLVTMFSLGILYGLGIAYGHRPEDERGVLNIWLVAVIFMIAGAVAIIEYFPISWREWSAQEKVIIGAMWFAFTTLLACVGLGKRREITKKTKKKRNRNNVTSQ